MGHDFAELEEQRKRGFDWTSLEQSLEPPPPPPPPLVCGGGNAAIDQDASSTGATTTTMSGPRGSIVASTFLQQPVNDFHLLLNIGGRPFRVRASTIQYRCPTSLLGDLVRAKHADRLQICDGYLDASQEYYFERTARLFEPIYDFLSTGHFHKPPDTCRERMLIEIDYWKIKRDYFAPCCMTSDEYSPMPYDDDEHTTKFGFDSVSCHDAFDGLCCGKQRRIVWDITENPGSSTTSKVWTMTSIFFVVVSVSALILSSVPELQQQPPPASAGQNLSANSGDAAAHAEIRPVHICIVWFSIEYVVRFLAAPRRLRFIRQPLNLIDLLTIVPFYLELFGSLAGVSSSSTIGEWKALALVMRVVRVCRVARVFKLARYSSGLKSFGVTVVTSLPELSMLMLFLLTAVIFFSTLMYFAERDEPNSKFNSIPAAMWWCVITLTTIVGKLIASCASISGVLVLAFPITMIVENFSKTYDHEKSDIKTLNRRRRMAKAYN